MTYIAVPYAINIYTTLINEWFNISRDKILQIS